MKLIKSILVVFWLVLGLVGAGCGSQIAESGIGTIDVVVTSTTLEGEASEVEIAGIETIISDIVIYPENAEEGDEISLYVDDRPFFLLKTSEQEKFLAFADVGAASFEKMVMTVERLDVTLSNGTELTVLPKSPFEFKATVVVFTDESTTVVFVFNTVTAVNMTEGGAVSIKPIAA
jgi:hypothetical protein